MKFILRNDNFDSHYFMYENTALNKPSISDSSPDPLKYQVLSCFIKWFYINNIFLYPLA